LPHDAVSSQSGHPTAASGTASGGRAAPLVTPSRELGPILERAWLASDQLSGKLLVPILPALLTALQTHHGVHIAPAIRAALTTASAATLDRLLRPLRRRRGRQPRRLATALHRVRTRVPLRTWSEWTGVAPGSLQGDLVFHCGESTEGLYCGTLVAVDVATMWTELQAIWGLHHQRVTGGIQFVQQRLPFPLRAWHSDNGSEFINACLLGWCQRRGIRFPRPALSQKRPGLGRAAQWPPRPPPRGLRPLQLPRRPGGPPAPLRPAAPAP